MDKFGILIVEDDEAIATGLALNLRLAGYTAVVAHDGEDALRQVAVSLPNLILLDINLPMKSGLEVVGELRRSGNTTPIIILSAREDEYDKVAALRLGADDYVTKPFGLAELLARVDAVLRRSRAVPVAVEGEATYAFSEIVVEPENRTVNRAGVPVKLTHLEFELLHFLLLHPSRVFSREALMRQVWGQASGSQRTIDNFVAQLRSKLEVDPENPQHFITVRGSGYRFDP